jgi:hypothetical protein
VIALAGADARADGAATLQRTALPQPAEVRFPGRFVGNGIVVHQKDVVGHPALAAAADRPFIGAVSRAPADLIVAACISETRTNARVRQTGCVSLAQAAWHPFGKHVIIGVA